VLVGASLGAAAGALGGAAAGAMSNPEVSRETDSMHPDSVRLHIDDSGGNDPIFLS
jgi:hypothetical protein